MQVNVQVFYTTNHVATETWTLWKHNNLWAAIDRGGLAFNFSEQRGVNLDFTRDKGLGFKERISFFEENGKLQSGDIRINTNQFDYSDWELQAFVKFLNN